MSRHRVRLAYSYARKDKEVLDAIEIALHGEKGRGRLRTWHDQDILPGEEWEARILQEMAQADCVLLLLGRNFLQSGFCMGTELPKALELRNGGCIHLLALLLDGSMRDFPPEVRRIQALNPDGIGIRDAIDPQKALAESVARLIDRIRSWSDEGAETLNRLPESFDRGDHESDRSWALRCLEEVEGAGDDAGAGAVRSLVPAIIAARRQEFTRWTFRLMRETLFVARWLAVEPDADRIWRLLHALGDLDLADDHRGFLAAAEAWFARCAPVLRVPGLDLRGLWADFLVHRRSKGDPVPTGRLVPEGGYYHCEQPSPSPLDKRVVLAFPSVTYSPTTGMAFVCTATGILRFDRTLRYVDRYNGSFGLLYLSHSPRRAMHVAFDGGTLTVHDSWTHVPLKSLLTGGGKHPGARSWCWSVEGDRFWALSDKTIRCWDARTGTLLLERADEQFYLKPIAAVPGMLAVLMDAPGGIGIALFDAETLAPAGQSEPIGGLERSLECVLVASAGRGDLALCSGRQVVRWDPATRKTTARIDLPHEILDSGHVAKRNPAQFSSDGSFLFLMTRKGTILGIDLDRNQVLSETASFGDEVHDFCEAGGTGDLLVAGEDIHRVEGRNDGGTPWSRSRVLIRGQNAGVLPNWCQTPGGNACWARTGQDGDCVCRACLQTLARHGAIHPARIIAHAVREDAALGVESAATLDENGVLRFWRTDTAVPLGSTHIEGFNHSSHIRLGFDGTHAFVMLEGQFLDRLRVVVAHCALDGQVRQRVISLTGNRDEYRDLFEVAPLNGGLLLTSHKGRCVWYWSDIVRDAAGDGAFLGRTPIDWVRNGPHENWWRYFVPSPDRPELYAWNQETWELAAFTWESSRRIRVRPLCRDIQVTSLHVAGRHLCVASNFQSAVYLVHIDTGELRVVAVEDDVGTARAYGPDLRHIEVFSASLENPPARYRRFGEHR